MTKVQLDKLLEYIDAAIASKSAEAYASSDGGLIEAIRLSTVHDELYATLKETANG